MTRRSEMIVTYVLLSVLALIAIGPVVGIALVGVQSPTLPVQGFPNLSSLHFENVSRAWDVGHFSLYMRSSVIVVIPVVLGATVLSVLGGYAFGIMRFPGRTLLFYVLMLGLVMPYEAMVIPIYYDLRGVGLTDTYWGLILPDIGISLSFGCFWMRAFFKSVPASLIEAAKIDGASGFTILRRILLPQAKPPIVAMMALLFMWTWNDFLFPLVMMQSEDRQTAPLGISLFQGQYTTDTQGLASAAVLVALPVVLVYVVLHRHFVRGMTEGAAKL
jgi:raffinose/stachyose/melibiose transport system permease protein